MILVVGGIHSGKKTFAREALGYDASSFVDATTLDAGGEVEGAHCVAFRCAVRMTCGIPQVIKGKLHQIEGVGEGGAPRC